MAAALVGERNPLRTSGYPHFSAFVLASVLTPDGDFKFRRRQSWEWYRRILAPFALKEAQYTSLRSKSFSRKSSISCSGLLHMLLTSVIFGMNVSPHIFSFKILIESTVGRVPRFAVMSWRCMTPKRSPCSWWNLFIHFVVWTKARALPWWVHLYI